MLPGIGIVDFGVVKKRCNKLVVSGRRGGRRDFGVSCYKLRHLRVDNHCERQRDGRRHGLQPKVTRYLKKKKRANRAEAHRFKIIISIQLICLTVDLVLYTNIKYTNRSILPIRCFSRSYDNSNFPRPTNRQFL